MIPRLALTLLEWAAAISAAALAASAATFSDIVVAALVAVDAAAIRGFAMSLAAGDSVDARLSALRAANRPSNDIGGL